MADHKAPTCPAVTFVQTQFLRLKASGLEFVLDIIMWISLRRALNYAAGCPLV